MHSVAYTTVKSGDRGLAFGRSEQDGDTGHQARLVRRRRGETVVRNILSCYCGRGIPSADLRTVARPAANLSASTIHEVLFLSDVLEDSSANTSPVPSVETVFRISINSIGANCL